MTVFRKLMAANRGEIAIRVFRSAHELGIRTVAVYSHEDRFALHRLKADEAYQVGKAGEPIRSYLGIPAIVGLAQEKQVGAIHPGYGFLSENAEFARVCARAGIVFVGPPPELLDLLGDKVAARNLAREAGVPILAGSDSPVLPGPGAHEVAGTLGYPVIVKAAMGGGGHLLHRRYPQSRTPQVRPLHPTPTRSARRSPVWSSAWRSYRATGYERARNCSRSRP